VSVHVVVHTDGSRKDCPPQYLANEFGSLGTLRTMLRIGNSTWHYGVLFVVGFPHVFYKSWLVGVATRVS